MFNNPNNNIILIEAVGTHVQNCVTDNAIHQIDCRNGTNAHFA